VRASRGPSSGRAWSASGAARSRARTAARAARQGRLEPVQKVLTAVQSTATRHLPGVLAQLRCYRYLGHVEEQRPEELRTKVYGERTVYDNPWVRLTLVDVEPPDGHRFEHHVVRLQTVALGLVVNDDDEVLMLWRHRFATDEWGWELPGGIADSGEDLAHSAAREVEEETGWRPGPMHPLVNFQPMPGMVDTPHAVFTARGAEKVSEPSDLEEAGRVGWVPLTAIPGLVAKGEILGSGSLVGLLYHLASHQRSSQ
jgi:8-oxo-dGTP pyrophosphatase MutT (NUDIX family)